MTSTDRIRLESVRNPCRIRAESRRLYRYRATPRYSTPRLLIFSSLLTLGAREFVGAADAAVTR
jgi:hypothetical protein